MNAFSSNKIFWHLDKLKAIKRNKPLYPVTFTIDPTNICNEDCDFCLNGMQRKNTPTELSLKEIKDILDLSKEIGVKGIKIAGGGEPLKYSKIEELLDLLALYDFDYGLNTNGSLMIPELYKKLSIFKYINVSIESFDPRIYKEIRKVDKVEQVKDNISLFQKNNFKTKLNISLLIHEKAYKDILKTVNIAKKLEVDSVNIKSLIFNQEYKNNYNSIDFKLLKKLINKAKKLETENFIINVKQKEIINYNKCEAIYLGGVWGADHKFHLCCDRRNSNIILFDFSNNVFDFKKHWASKEHMLTVKKINPFKECESCSYNSYNIILQNLDDMFEELI